MINHLCYTCCQQKYYTGKTLKRQSKQVLKRLMPAYMKGYIRCFINGIFFIISESAVHTPMSTAANTMSNHMLLHKGMSSKAGLSMCINMSCIRYIPRVHDDIR